jgi:hypothetical protein
VASETEQRRQTRRLARDQGAKTVTVRKYLTCRDYLKLIEIKVDIIYRWKKLSK